MSEYKSIHAYVGDGVNTRWSTNFSGGFISPEHIFYEIDGTETEASLDGTVVVIDPPVPAGTPFTIKRVTPVDAPLVDFLNGADISEYNLDTSSRQAVFAAAEAIDRGIRLADTDGLLAENSAGDRNRGNHVGVQPLASISGLEDALGQRPTTDDLASPDAGKGAELVAGAGKVIPTRAAMKALTNASDKARPLQLTEGVRGGAFVWNNSDLSAKVALDASEGIYIPPTSDPTGASGAWVRQFDGVINAKWFGATGDGVTDDTAALQAAADFVLNNFFHTLYIPSGKYKFDTLDCTDTASGNARADRGKFRVVGDGSLSFSDLYGTTTQEHGTILECTSVDGTNGVVISGEDTDNRKVQVESLTIRYGGTGYALSCVYMPEMYISDVSVGVSSATGKALYLSDVWYGVVDRFTATAKATITSTADGVTLANTIFAGELVFRDSKVLHFRDNFHYLNGANFSNVLFDNCTSERFNRYGFHCEAPLWNLTFRNYYTETASGTNAFKIAPSGLLSNLKIDGLFMLGGEANVQWLTGPVLDIANVQQFDICGVEYYQPWSPFLNIGAGVGSGTIDGIDVKHSAAANLPTGPLYMITGTNVKQGVVTLSNRTLTATTKMAWFDPAIHRVAQNDGKYTRTNALSFGRTAFVPLNIGVYNWEAAEPRPMVVAVTATGGGDSAVRLPILTGVENGDIRYIVNLPAPASTRGVGVRDFANANVGYTIPIGGSAMCIADTVNNKWLVLPFQAGAYGP